MKYFIVILALALSACSQPDVATRVLSDQGYTDIKIEGYSWWGCSDGDDYATKFKAKSIIGKDVSGVVCGGILKNNTIRLD